MAAWPRNVVREHRCAAWLLYLFLISLFITYASYTINHNLQRRDEPVVVEDIREEEWTLPDITACILFSRGLVEMQRYTCGDLYKYDATCYATAHIISSKNDSNNGIAKFCASFETSKLAPRSRGDATLLEFTWIEVNPLNLNTFFTGGEDGELREATVLMSGFDDFDEDSTNLYYLPISTAVLHAGHATDMFPAKEVHRRLGHPYSLPPPPTTDEIGFKATFTTSPVLDYDGNNSDARFTSCDGFVNADSDDDDERVPNVPGCPGHPIFEAIDKDNSPFSMGYFQVYVNIQSLQTRYYIEQDPMEPLKLWGILAGTFTQVGMLFGLCFIGKAHLRARFSGRAAEAVGERSSRLGARLSSTPAVTRLRTRSASLGARLSTVARFPGSKASRSEGSDADASAAVELGEVTNPVSSPEPLGRGELAPPRASGLL